MTLTIRPATPPLTGEARWTLPIEKIVKDDLDGEMEKYIRLYPDKLSTSLCIECIEKRANRCALVLFGSIFLDDQDKKMKTVLHYAAQQNCPELVERLLEKNVTIFESVDALTALDIAVIKEFDRVISCFRGYMTHFPCQSVSALHRAVTKGPATLVQTLELFSDISLCDHKGMTPLHSAVEAKNRESVRILLDRGAKPDSLDEYGRSPVSMACQLQSDEIVDLFLQHPVNLDVGAPAPLTTCFFQHNYTLARKLLAKGASANVQIGPDTLLELAKLSCNDRFCTLLLEFGATKTDLYKELEAGQFAIKQSSFSLSNIPRSPRGESPFLIMCKAGSLGEVFAVINHNGVRFDEVDSKGNNALHLAIMSNNISVIFFIAITFKALIHQKNHLGETPLHYACYKSYFMVVSLLLTLGADCMAKTATGLSCMHYIAKSASRQYLSICLCIDYLLAKNKQLLEFSSQRDKMGVTPMELAYNELNREVIERFLLLGVDPDIATSDNITLFLRSFQMRQYSLCELLVQFGASRNYSLLHEVIQNQEEAWVSLLVRKFPAVRKKSKAHDTEIISEGKTALVLALEMLIKELESPQEVLLESLTSYRIVDILLETGANCNQSGIDSRARLVSPLLLAVESKSLFLVRRLLIHKANPNAEAAFETAVTLGCREIIELFLKRDELKITETVKSMIPALPDAIKELLIRRLPLKERDKLKSREASKIENSMKKLSLGSG